MIRYCITGRYRTYGFGTGTYIFNWNVYTRTPLATAFLAGGEELGYLNRDGNGEYQTGFMIAQVGCLHFSVPNLVDYQTGKEHTSVQYGGQVGYTFLRSLVDYQTGRVNTSSHFGGLSNI